MDASTAGSTISRTGLPSSTASAVSSRRPPSRITASGAVNGGRSARRNPGLALSPISNVDNRCNPRRCERARDGTKRRELTDPAQGEGRAGLDVSDVGLDGVTNLLMPVGFGVDRCGDALAELLDVGPQQLQEALFLAVEPVVEGALGRAGVADDVGDRAGAVAAFIDRGGEAVEQPKPKRIRLSRRVAGNRVLRRRCHR